MKRILTIFFLCAYGSISTAQLMPFNDHYIDNTTILNPASCDLSDRIGAELVFSATYRRQWLNLPDGPKSFFIRAEHTTLNLNANAFTYGGYLLNDNAGAIGLTGLYGKGAYVFNFAGRSVNYLSVGLALGILQYRVNTAAILQNAAPINIENVAAWYPDAGLGIYYYNELFHIGFSSPQVMSLDTRFQINDTNYYTKRLRHYFFNVGGYLTAKENLDLKPELWLRFVPEQALDVNMSLLAEFYDKFYTGAGISLKQGHNQSILFSPNFFGGVMLEVNQQHTMKIGASYGNSTAIYNAAFGATYEFNIVYYIDYAN
jgi:type IX secretion system PorP/SprF family membrane protein